MNKISFSHGLVYSMYSFRSHVRDFKRGIDITHFSYSLAHFFFSLVLSTVMRRGILTARLDETKRQAKNLARTIAKFVETSQRVLEKLKIFDLSVFYVLFFVSDLTRSDLFEEVPVVQCFFQRFLPLK